MPSHKGARTTAEFAQAFQCISPEFSALLPEFPFVKHSVILVKRGRDTTGGREACQKRPSER
eukprot:8312221-Prorocentrum_lima.AAC.1